MSTELRTNAVTYAISKNRIDEAAGKRIDSAVHNLATYTTKSSEVNAHVMQSQVLKAYEGLPTQEKMVFDRAYGEVMGFGHKDMRKWLKATHEAANAPEPAPAPAAAEVKAEPAQAAKVATAASTREPPKGFLKWIMSFFT